MSNLSVLQRNICDMIYHEDEETMNEAQSMFLRFCDKDKPPYHKAERLARTWLQAGGFLKIMETDEVRAIYCDIEDEEAVLSYEKNQKEVRQFIKVRAENWIFPQKGN